MRTAVVIPSQSPIPNPQSPTPRCGRAVTYYRIALSYPDSFQEDREIQKGEVI